MAQHVLITTVITSVAASLVTKEGNVNKVSNQPLFFIIKGEQKIYIVPFKVIFRRFAFREAVEKAISGNLFQRA